MLTKHAFALLSLGGTLRAKRTFPHPHHYAIEAAGLPPAELSEDDVISLLAHKHITPPSVAQLGDTFEYGIADRAWAKAQALRDFKFGFGRCPVCGTAPVGVTAQGVAARHGFTGSSPACEGSGKPLIGVVRRDEAAA